jgi:ubiquinone/menaquinone biosynthesis C-methylase UbiE
MFSDPIKNLAELDVQDGMKVADIGAGSGFYSIETAKKVGARGLVYAVDIQQDLLERLKKSAALVGLHNIEIIWGNAEKIGGTKLRENIADRVIVSNVLFQIESKDRDNFVLELKRIVKPGGKLLLVDWQSGSPLTPPNAVSVMTAEALFQKAGWTLEKNFDAGDHHYGIILKKP